MDNNKNDNSNKENFNLNIYPKNGYKYGYHKAFLEGDKINGSVEIEFIKPEMVKCIRVQLIGFISKNRELNNYDVLRYIDSYEKHNITEQDGDASKYDGLKILVDQDWVLWGDRGDDYFVDSSIKDTDGFKDLNDAYNFLYKINTHSSASSKDVYSTRTDLINTTFNASFIKSKKLPFYFELKHKSNNSSIPLPSSYKIKNYQIEYFVCATIYKDWQNKKIMYIKKLRVYQSIDIDQLEPMYPIMNKELWKISDSDDNKIKMKASLPRDSFCHREIIPINIELDNLSQSKIIEGFLVSLYEICSIKYSSKKIETYHTKVLSERFYETQIMPNRTKINKILFFPLIDGNCYIKKRDSRSNSSKEEEDEALQLMDVKLSPISATINERSRWPIIVEHKLRIIVITNDEMNDFEKVRKKKYDGYKDNTESNLFYINNNEDLIRSMRRIDIYDSYYNNDSVNSFHSNSSSNLGNSPLGDHNDDDSNNNNNNDNNNTNSDSKNNSNNTINKISNSLTSLSMDDLNYNNALYNTMRYGEIFGDLSNDHNYWISESKKILDTQFNIRIGTITKAKRECGNELYINENFADQYYEIILNNSKYKNKLFEKGGLKKIDEIEKFFSGEKLNISINNNLRGEGGGGGGEEEEEEVKKETLLSVTSTPKSLLYVSNNSLMVPNVVVNQPGKKKSIGNHPNTSKVSPIFEAILSSSIITNETSQIQSKSDILHDDLLPSLSDYGAIFPSPHINSISNNNSCSNSMTSINSNSNSNRKRSYLKEEPTMNPLRRLSSSSIYSNKASDSPSRKSSLKTEEKDNKNSDKKSIKSHPLTTEISPIYEATLSTSLCQAPNQIRKKSNITKP